MKVLYLAGETAKLHGISKQTLIYYDRIDLFRPKHCDEETGYRYYSLEQFVDLDVILCLKKFGMPLEEIKTYLQQTAIHERIAMLEEHRVMVKRKIADLNKSENRLKKTIHNLKARNSIQPFSMGIRREPARPYVSRKVPPPHDDECLEIAIKSLFEDNKDRSDTGIDELLVFSTRKRDSNVPLFHSVGLDVEDKPYELLPETDLAYIYHKGTFEAVNSSYESLLQYIEEEGYRPSTDVIIEKILLDALAVCSQKEYLIEIQIRVKKR